MRLRRDSTGDAFTDAQRDESPWFARWFARRVRRDAALLYAALLYSTVFYTSAARHQRLSALAGAFAAASA